MDFDVSWWKVAWWATGTFGVAGAIALAVFAPAVFQLALSAVVRFGRIVLSTRIGCAVVAAIVAAFIADYARHDIEDGKRRAENAAFEKAQEERDARIAYDTRQWVLKEIEDQAKQNVTTDKEVKDFTDALPKPPPETGNVFRVGDDACRLRRIAGQGQAGCGSDRAQTVSKPDTPHANLRDRIRNRLPGALGGSARSHGQGQ